MQIVRKKLSADEISPPNKRYHSETDTVQTTPDGGTTWNDDPGSDPRTNTAYQLPPLTTSDPRCDAAANMVAYLRSMIDVDVLAMENWSRATALLSILLLIIPGGVLVDLILLSVGIIAAEGASAIAAAFTEGVYDNFLCYFYNNLDADGILTDAGLTALIAEVEAGEDSTVVNVFEAHNHYMLFVGWTNAGASGSETGDCSACATCTDYSDDFQTGALGDKTFLSVSFSNQWPTGGEINDGGGGDYRLKATLMSSSTDYGVTVWVDLGQECLISEMSCAIYRDNGGHSGYYATYDAEGTRNFISDSFGGPSNAWDTHAENPGVVAQYLVFVTFCASNLIGYIDDLSVIVG